MLGVLTRILPFFAVIGIGYASGRFNFISEAATAGITRFVFYFALSALLFRFASNLSLEQIFDLHFVMAYLSAGFIVFAIAAAVAFWRRLPLDQAAMEALVAVSGNTGFMGLPMLVALLGQAAAGPMLLIVSMDMIVFSSLVTLFITAARTGRLRLETFRHLGLGLVKNPMIVSMVAGLLWSASGAPVPKPLNEFMALLGGAATPGALFAIGASLASKSAERLEVAIWLSACKLLLHPAMVAVMA
ncbi:AEC family transporter, partial [Thioclava sp. BHET1]